jgi:hypothetical protein
MTAIPAAAMSRKGDIPRFRLPTAANPRRASLIKAPD